MDSRIVSEYLDGVGVLIAQQKLKLSVLMRLKSRGITQDGAEFHVLRGRKCLEDGPLLEELHLYELYARENLETGRQPIVC